jgi:alkylated DNA repair dioxygenase AlkB
MPSLFTSDTSYEVLPYDGSALYYPHAIPTTEADIYLQHLLQDCPWQPDEVIMFGKKIVTARKYVWFADEGCSYTYSRTTKSPTSWNNIITRLKTDIELLTTKSFNACLLNLYHNGKEAMSWHSDNEPELGIQPFIVSVSFGAERPFAFRHKASKQTIKLTLHHGSMLVMSGETQQAWLHALPRSSTTKNLRINATFRQVSIPSETS